MSVEVRGVFSPPPIALPAVLVLPSVSSQAALILNHVIQPGPLASTQVARIGTQVLSGDSMIYSAGQTNLPVAESLNSDTELLCNESDEKENDENGILFLIRQQGIEAFLDTGEDEWSFEQLKVAFKSGELDLDCKKHAVSCMFFDNVWLSLEFFCQSTQFFEAFIKEFHGLISNLNVDEEYFVFCLRDILNIIFDSDEGSEGYSQEDYMQNVQMCFLCKKALGGNQFMKEIMELAENTIHPWKTMKWFKLEAQLKELEATLKLPLLS